jgi:hypothetical protein
MSSATGSHREVSARQAWKVSKFAMAGSEGVITQPSLPATNAKRLCKGALATKQSIVSVLRQRWIASLRSQ